MPARRPSAARALIWLRDSATPMFVINSQRRLVLFNQGCELISGWQAADVLGKRIEAVTNADSTSLDAILAAMSPPPDVFSGQACQVEVCWPHQSQSAESRVVQFWPIYAPDRAAMSFVLGLVGEVHVASGPPIVTAHLKWHRELAWLRTELRRRYQQKTLLGRCPAIQRAMEQVRLAEQSLVPVFLTGESGTGKEHFARAIHLGSRFEARAFVHLDGLLTPVAEQKQIFRRLIQDGDAQNTSDLFRPGSLYISHLEELHGDVLERLGNLLSSTPPFRLITSSLRPLASLVASEILPEALAMQLSPISISLPPLRERGDDVLLLAQAFLEECNRGSEIQVIQFDEQVALQWQRYRWPGNLKELKKVVQEAHATCADGILQATHLPFRFRAGTTAMQQVARRRKARSLDLILEETERHEMTAAISECGGNLTQAAEQLGIPRARLYRRMDQLGLRRSDKPPADSAPSNPETVDQGDNSSAPV